jgi:hypothetical protein
MRTKTIAALAGVSALCLPAAALADHGQGKDKGQGHGRPGAPGQADKHDDSSSTTTTSSSTGSTTNPGSNQDQGNGNGHSRNLLFKGTISSVSTTADTVSVMVTGGDHAARTYRGQTVTFDLSHARIRAAATPTNPVRNQLADLVTGDRVVVHVKLAKGATATQPFPAQQLVDQSRKHV